MDERNRKMKGKRFSTCLAAMLVLSVAPVQAQDPLDLLARMARHYGSMTSYHLEGKVSVLMTTGSGEQELEMDVLMARRPPAFLRAEVAGPTVQMVIVTNEEGTWMYMPSLEQYVFSENSAPTEVGDMTEDLLGEYQRVDRNVSSARISGRERLEVGGESRETVVVDVVYEPEPTAAGADSTRKRLWVDADRMLVVKDQTDAYISDTPFGEPMRIRETTAFHLISVGADPPADMFTFEPPANAVRVDSEEFGGGSRGTRIGQAAPDFELPDLQGEMTRLAELKGNVVVVNLWATWCGPCRMEMPALERLHGAYADLGLRILGVNLGESMDVVSTYVAERNLTFPILLDGAAYVGDLYGAQSLPTSIIIDREGRISQVLVGAQAEEIFIQAVQEAGL